MIILKIDFREVLNLPTTGDGFSSTMIVIDVIKFFFVCGLWNLIDIGIIAASKARYGVDKVIKEEQSLMIASSSGQTSLVKSKLLEQVMWMTMEWDQIQPG